VREDTLPQVTWILPAPLWSKHPSPSSPLQGAEFTSRVLDALTANPKVWGRTVFFLTFDENDGQFDHIARISRLPTATPPGTPEPLFQEPGVRPSRALGYELCADAGHDLAEHQVRVNFRNTGGLGAPGRPATRRWLLIESGHWYDFTAQSQTWSRRFAGRLETGLHSVSDPAIAVS